MPATNEHTLKKVTGLREPVMTLIYTPESALSNQKNKLRNDIPKPGLYPCLMALVASLTAAATILVVFFAAYMGTRG